MCGWWKRRPLQQATSERKKENEEAEPVPLLEGQYMEQHQLRAHCKMQNGQTQSYSNMVYCKPKLSINTQTRMFQRKPHMVA